MRNIFLEKNRSKKSVNEDIHLGVDLSSKARLLPYNSTNDVLSLNDLYTKERNECTKYRVILAVNPICSNVLFNTRTEVVRYEGSDNCELLVGNKVGNAGQAVNTTTFDWKQALRDTEYTHPDLYAKDNGEPYVYHCGFDIFNNHMLRKNDFVYINKTKRKNGIFNTLSDVVRDNDGNEVKEVVSLTDVDGEKSNVHVYQYDTVMSFYDAFIENLKEKDGWYGFYNTTNIAIPNAIVKNKDNEDTEISINKVMNNNKPCELIDLYPDRSLYSFIPKVNKYRHRIEKNWDYCLSYPYEKDVRMLNVIMGLDEDLTMNNGGGSIKVQSAKLTYSSTGNKLVRLESVLKTTIKAGDYITLYYLVDGVLNKLPNKINVLTTGDYEGNETDRYFSFRFSEITSKFDLDDDNNIVTKDGKTPIFYYKKNVVGYDCEYYLRKFKKIKNINGDDLISVVNKMAYGENIYGDRIAQVVFTDTVDVEGLLDEKGRTISDMYFTVIKRNKGHEKWYDEGITNTEDIEFSHCFGDVTSGIDMLPDVDDYNVRKLHNIDVKTFTSDSGNKIVFENLKEIKPIQSAITIDDEFWYGDIIEFDVYNYKENVICFVEQRFNTAQREHYKDDKFGQVIYDRLLYDDYDVGVTKDENNNIVSEFTVSSSNIATVRNKTFYGNLNPEGYFYNPFTKIKLQEELDNKNKVNGTNIKYDSGTISMGVEQIKNEENETVSLAVVSLRTSIDYGFVKNDTVAFYHIDTGDIYWLNVFGVDGCEVSFASDNINMSKVTGWLLRKEVYIVKTNEGVPTYAKYLPNSHSFVWRSFVPSSELPTDSDIADRPFANGCFYIEKNVNLFLKRQDPINEYGLLSPPTSRVSNVLNQYKVWGWDPVNFEKTTYNKLFNGICQ